MRRNVFHQILTQEQLSNEIFIKEYLSYSFNKRLPQKSKFLYANLVNIYNFYPDIVCNIILNINKFGYYKDLFHILKQSDSPVLNEFIINFVVDQIRLDVNALKSGNKPSTLGKYLPREKSTTNQKINFIDQFNLRYFVDNGKMSKIKGRILYRKLKSEINKQLGTLEPILCTKSYNSLDLSKVSYIALKNNRKSMESNQITALKLKDHDEAKLLSLSFEDFMYTTQKPNSDYSSETIQNAWEKFDYMSALNFFHMNMLDVQNAYYILDLSQETFRYNLQYLYIGFVLCCEQLVKRFYLEGMDPIDENGSMNNTANLIKFSENFIVNVSRNNVNLNMFDKYLDKVNYLNENIGPCPLKRINFDTIDRLKNIILLSTFNERFNSKHNHTFYHLLRLGEDGEFENEFYHQSSGKLMPVELKSILEVNPTTLARNSLIKSSFKLVGKKQTFAFEMYFLVIVMLFLSLRLVLGLF